MNADPKHYLRVKDFFGMRYRTLRLVAAVIPC
jgi:hypothetical protein